MNIIEIGAQIRAARKKRKLSQRELAGILGMSRTRLSQVETGDAFEIGLQTLQRICMALDLELIVEPMRIPTWEEASRERDEQMLKRMQETDRILMEMGIAR